MPKLNHDFQAPGLFDDLSEQNGQRALIEAEYLLLDIADFVYAQECEEVT